MTEKEIIEKMEKDIRSSLRLHIQKTILYPYLARDLYTCGYRKIPEGSVVLTDEEAERFRGQTVNIAKVKSQARKEMAKEILKKVDSESNGQTKQITDLIRKQHGVEE